MTNNKSITILISRLFLSMDETESQHITVTKNSNYVQL